MLSISKGNFEVNIIVSSYLDIFRLAPELKPTKNSIRPQYDPVIRMPLSICAMFLCRAVVTKKSGYINKYIQMYLC